MIERRSGHRAAAAAGLSTLAAFVAAILLMPAAWFEVLHENGLDLVLAADQKVRARDGGSATRSVIVVDIDRRSLEAIGPWPWPRDAMARLVEAVVAASPAAIAIDVLFAGTDSRSPAALARTLAAVSGNAAIAALANSLPDGDKLLAAAIERRHVALGFALDAGPGDSVAGVPVLGAAQLDLLWQVAGAVAPLETLSDAAAGVGTLSLPGDADGTIRHVPMLVGVDRSLRPGLALEAVRVAEGALSYLLQPSPPHLMTGKIQIPIPPDGFLRLVPIDSSLRDARTVSATDVLNGDVDRSRLAGAIVLIGGSAPELGGLRPTTANPLTASVQIQADAVQQMLAGRNPLAVPDAIAWTLIGAVGTIALVAASMLGPLLSAVVVAIAISALWAAGVALSVQADRLLDPLPPTLCGVVVFVATSVAAYASARKRAAWVQQRFEQHLAPAVVRRIVAEPGLLKLAGERREVTALFTDIQNFTSMTHRADPVDLVAALDAYIEGVTDLVIGHGGMVDKIVGDAVHALFNAPVDLENHSVRAVECAVAIRTWTQEFTSRPAAVALGFERTRIGVETGSAIVGDIGIRTKLDYTAHGDAVNAAARLEAANKTLGSSICLGPVVASRVDPSTIRPLGTISMRGRDEEIAVFEPWPVGMSSELRRRYLEAFRIIDSDPSLAATHFAAMAAEYRNDAVLPLMAERLRRMQPLDAV